MSAFVVDNQVINRVVTYIAGDEYLSLEFADMPLPIGQEDGEAHLAESMFQLNVEAIEQRYGKGEAAKFRPLDFHYRRTLALPVQVLKSLRCWLYQCSEGNVPERDLYRRLDAISGRIALRIVQASNAYDAAEW